MAFQVIDDVLDIVATDEELGKPSGNDLVEGIYTLPVLRALSDESIGPELRAMLGGRLDLADRDVARDMVRSSDGVSYSIAAARTYADKAVEAISVLPANDARDALMRLAYVLIESVPRRG